MSTTVQQWGNSRGVRIPKSVADKFGLTIGREVEFADAGGQLVIRPVRRQSRYKLSDLLKGCKGRPHADAWSKPMGSELI